MIKMAAPEGQADQDLLASAPEISVWMTAYGCLRSLTDIQAAHPAQTPFNERYYRQSNQVLIGLAAAADATHRFGVVLPVAIEPNYKKRAKTLNDAFLNVDFYPTFWRWFNWWDAYVKSLTPEITKHIYTLAADCLPELHKYRPTGNWLDHSPAPSLVLSDLALP